MVNLGSLSVILTLIDLYAKNYESEDATLVPARLSRLLEGQPEPIKKSPRRLATLWAVPTAKVEAVWEVNLRG